MIYAEVLTEWIGDGLSRATALRPRIVDDYPQDAHAYRWDDVTMQPAANLTPEPNAVVIGVTCDETLLALLELDSRYRVIYDEPR